jgi:hypothetical protein
MNETIVWVILGYIIAFLIAAVIIRAVFSIAVIVRHLKAQTWFLALLAEKQGVDTDVIKNIVKVANNIDQDKISI